MTYTVLYIEDNAANVRLMERVFERRPDLDLISATHGLSGIDMAVDRQPDVVLLDMDLPDIHGGIVLKCLRGKPSTAAIPVVVVSADATDRHIQTMLESGAFAYMTKPYDVRDLLTTIDELIQLGEARPRSTPPDPN